MAAAPTSAKDPYVFKPHPEYVQGRRTALCLGASIKSSTAVISSSFFGSPIFDANTLTAIFEFDLSSSCEAADPDAVQWELETKYQMQPRDYRLPTNRGTPIEIAAIKDGEPCVRKFELLVHTSAYYDFKLERLNLNHRPGSVQSLFNQVRNQEMGKASSARFYRKFRAVVTSWTARSRMTRTQCEVEVWTRGLERRLREQKADPDAIKMSRLVLEELVLLTDDWPTADATPEGNVRITTLRPHCAWIVVHHDGSGRSYVMGAVPSCVFNVLHPSWYTTAFREW